MMENYTKKLVLAMVLVGVMLINTNDLLISVLEYDHHLTWDSHQWWRLITGHLTHWGFGHFAWDFALFAILCWMCIKNNVKNLGTQLLIAAGTIALFLPWVEPSILRYRGLSGIDSALFALLCCSYIKEAAAGDRRIRFAAIIMLVGFLVKSMTEMILGSPIFVQNAEFINLPSVHLIGAACGATTFWGFDFQSHDEQEIIDEDVMSVSE